MRILMLAQSFAPVIGGEERVVEKLSGELKARVSGEDSERLYQLALRLRRGG